MALSASLLPPMTSYQDKIRANPIYSKLERAYKHIRDIDSAFIEFFDTGAYKVRGNIEGEPPHYILRVHSVQPIPGPLLAIIGDALQNFRSTLDYLAGQLVIAAGNQPDRLTCFPIFDDIKKYESDSPRKVRGMTAQAIEAIRDLKPYKAGNPTLWKLHRLNNVDKHRALVMAGNCITGQTIPRSARVGLLKAFMERRLPGEPIPDYQAVIGRPHFPTKPLKDGDIIMSLPLTEVDDNANFQCSISFAEPGICEGEPVGETLHDFSKLVGNIIVGFAPMISL